MPKPSAKLDRFEEAVAWFRARVPLTDRQLRAMDRRAEQRAFRVADVNQVRVTESVFKAIDRAIADGTTFDDFKREVGAKLRDEWQGTVSNPSWRMETIFRTNVQTAYSAGRVREFSEPDMLVMRPYWAFDATLDLRTTDVCRQCNGTILPASAAWWATHTPPLHFNCRSALRSLTKADVAERDYDHGAPPPAAQPATGFGTLDAGDFVADLSDVDHDLRHAHRSKGLAHRRRSR